jgi:KDO2-lipid IV(A) lauroyltransferase
MMPFFGRPAPIPLGPAAIAVRLGTPLLPVCVFRLADDTYSVEATAPVIAQSTGDPRVDEVRVTQELLRHIEGFIRRHPDQWHVPHRMWEGSP